MQPSVRQSKHVMNYFLFIVFLHNSCLLCCHADQGFLIYGHKQSLLNKLVKSERNDFLLVELLKDYFIIFLKMFSSSFRPSFSNLWSV